ncbi:hypothetical protein HY504_03325 [Candidatus Wolfebacteria bacterium]|nr:hypothetical protein [Candidatus Wolfebacteria bacterium]
MLNEQKRRVTDIIRRDKSQEKKKDIPPIRDRSVEAELEGIEKEVRQIAREAERVDDKFSAFETEEAVRFGRENEKAKRRRFTAFHFIFAFIVLLALGGGAYSVLEILPRVRVSLVLAKASWTYNDSVIASKGVVAPHATSTMIPAQVFTARKNFTFTYPASAKRQVSRRAHGTITIVNAYSSAAQPLVAQTRFADGAGKIFRLDKSVVVPGAQIKDGKVVPSRIEVAVTADKPGEAYNIAPVTMTIPGFIGTPKHEGFYGEMTEPISGGFIGEAAYPTDDDIVRAKAEARKGIKDAVESFLSLQIPRELKFLDGARQFSIVKETVNDTVDPKGNFGYYIEAESRAMVFRESDVVRLMTELAGQALGKNNLEAKTYKLEYGTPRLDIAKGIISLLVKFEGDFWEPMKPDEIKKALEGKTEAEVRAYLFGLADRERATVTFWPFWVKTVPRDQNRIAITVE